MFLFIRAIIISLNRRQIVVSEQFNGSDRRWQGRRLTGRRCDVNSGPETITGYNVTALHLLTSASTVHHLTVNVNINYSRVIQQGPACQFLDVEYKMSRSWGRCWKINVKGTGSDVFDKMGPQNTGTGGEDSESVHLIRWLLIWYSLMMPDRVKFSTIAPRGHVRINSGYFIATVDPPSSMIQGI
ncbi:hypothetical protein OIU77_013399 [Salix suchowensis]|uniref:Uncharacterized protein n=1 Tax=Salix suchowensis TaxID=1278906 RepID=A0ABQ8ZU36_9ROSI|nr:hypothetical protein OIU77_013399 [Salix suchowensis]KAJ6357816.1 hypothetical protein OIU78_005619 [Salix suchowensis]